ncbi:hypothetical protein RJT34_02993 [Clitoria ternatea]|uniref:DUF4408 domain-containing protein n=1 Tax=Clitoria ternatea TaxID=43366 RepID=A0AAN9KM43_CLITE
MEPTQVKKIQAMKLKRYKRRQFLDNLYFYFFTALTCSLFCCVTLCLPYLSSLVRAFFFVHISSLVTVLLSTKFLFIIGNIIIFFLVVNSRILSSDTSSAFVVYYDEYIQSSQIKMPQAHIPEVKKARKLEKLHVVENVDMREEWVNNMASESWPAKEEENIDEGDGKSLVFSSDYDELNKRAEDFIARVNRQRKLELSLLQYSSF